MPDGYDLESKIFTVSAGVAQNEDLSPEDAVKFLRTLLGEFCFKPDDQERATSVAIAQMLTLYCSLILTPHTVRPLFLITANAEGAGKTLLAKLAVISRLCYCPCGTAPTEEAEWRKLIFSTALSRSPVLFIDNAKGHLKSAALEALATSPILQDRVLGQSRNETILHGLTVFITGNGVTISGDLRRRTLLIELFLEEARAEDRIIQKPLDDATILSLRPKILSALWALVRKWGEAGKPEAKITHSSFLPWSKIVGAILEGAGFCSPCSMPVLDTSGDPDQIDMEKLIGKLVVTKNLGNRFEFRQLVTFAKDHGLFDQIIPESDNDPKAAAKRSALAILWKRFKDRIFCKQYKFCISGQSQKTRRYHVEQIRN